MNQITRQRADELLRNASERFIVVYGDVMLDEFVWGDVTRISPEAPVPVVDIRRESVHLGGAANVLANLRALGLSASVVGVVRADRERRTPVDGPTEERIVETLRGLLKGADALVVSDYDKGAVTPGVLG